MKNYIFLLITFFTFFATAADVKISQLPLGTASTTGVNDSFPYVAAATNITKRLTVWDLVNLPTIVSTYAPKASPVFTGTVTAPTFIGSLTGNASTATALAANPTDCGSNTYAQSIAANGNLTCAAISNASTTGVSTNTPSTLVLRDGSGNFSAGAITASLTGNSSTATALASNPTDCGSNTFAQSIAASGNLTCAAVNINSADVTGTLPVGSGGTGQASNLNQYGVIYGSTTTAMASTAAGTTGQFFKANTGSAPTWQSFTAPTISFVSVGAHTGGFSANATGTYTTPAGVSYIKVKMIGAGGGGSGSGTAGGGTGTVGASTVFGTSLLTAGGGSPGAYQNASNGVGGTPTINSPAYGWGINGGNGGGREINGTGATQMAGAPGGQGFFGGGAFGSLQTSLSAATNSGGGGVGGGTSATSNSEPGTGGGAGAYIEAYIVGPSATYSYTAGAGGGGGTAGTNGFAGGAGAGGMIIVEEYYH